ncbi:phage tail protein [Laribacter hongkongensis]|uniref:phage tail protein n=1 Tax=Laribacter hongkongensis TaxID=168471 RepID=UPI0003FC2771|nr:phage tail protein [Laribacter hongkongensis]
MTIYQRPDEKVFAQNALPGELQEFPDILRGWGVTFEQTDGFPPMEWFNALAKRQDEAIRYMIQQGISEWSASEQYPTGAYVKHGARTWRSKTANTNKQPDTNPEDWVEWGFDRAALDGKLGKSETAADSAKLGGQPPEHYAKASDLAKAGGDPLLWPRTSPSRTHIQAGYAPLDGQELSRALYPDAWAAIQAGAVPVVTEADWQTDPLKRGAFTHGDGVSTFRMPDWNGKSAGSKGALFVRGDGALSTGTLGLIQGDAIKSHAITIRGPGFPGSTSAPPTVAVNNNKATGFHASENTTGLVDIINANDGMPYARYVGDSETRPLNVSSVWVCRLFGAVTNPGSADASQLATEVARLWAQLASKLDVSAAFGHGQEWRDVSSERRCGVTYTNTTGRAILVRITAHAAIQPFVDGKAIGGVGYGSVTIVDTIPVPAGKTYSNNGSSFLTWQEWR